MAWATQNERIAALAAGLGGDLLGLKPWATAGIQDLDAAIAAGNPIDITDLGAPPAVDFGRLEIQSPYGTRPRRLARRR